MRRVDLIVEGQPYSKARPRVTTRGTYTPKVQKANEEALAWQIRLACEHRPFEAAVEVGLIFYRSNRQRIDIDNLVKQVLDAANGVAWKDDAQVTSIVARKRFDGERPRTVISIRDDHDTNFETPVEREREAQCRRCGIVFRYVPYPSQPKPRVCSRTCTQTVVCANGECGRKFTPNVKSQRYCTRECAARCKKRNRLIADRRRAAARAKDRCQRCGKELARRGAVLCREHWLENTHQRKVDLTNGTAR